MIPEVTLTYDPHHGTAQRDGDVDLVYEAIRDGYRDSVRTTTASYYLVLRCRIGHRAREIRLTLQHAGITYPVNADGTVTDWGDFPDIGLNLLGQLLG